MEKNHVELGRACDGSRVFRESRDSVSEGVNRGIGDDLGGKNGGGVPEMKRKVDGFVSWASSVNEFRAFRIPKHSPHGVSEGVNRESNVKNDFSEGNTTCIQPERAINNDGFVMKVDEGEGELNADEGSRVLEMHSGDGDVLLEEIFMDEKNVVGVIERVDNDETIINVDVDLDLDAQNRPGEELLSEKGIGGGEGIAVAEVLNESNVVFYDLGVNNVASPYKGVGPNENQEPMLDVKSEGNDGNILKVVPNLHGEECEYHPSDLVWGKVRRSPWWPGQLFEPSAASENAQKHFKEGSYLVAYFGNKTFAWNEAAKIKPFHSHFTEMKKQSNLGGFSKAVSSALDEVSRRVEFGLSCSCWPQEQLAKIESQTIVNGGILDEASRRRGGGSGDKISSPSEFVPAKLLQDLKSLAVSPKNTGTDRLRLVTARSQLVAYHRWKGFCGVHDGGAPSGKVLWDKKPAENRGRKRGRPLSSSKEHRAIAITIDDSVPGDSKLKRSKKVQLSSTQKESPPTPKLESVPESSHRGSTSTSTVSDFPKPDEMLSKLFSAAASDPNEGYRSLYPYMSLFSNFRNSVSLDTKVVGKCKESVEKDKTNQALFAAESLSEKTKEVDVVELEAENPVIDEEYTPTALSLKFNSLESLPSVPDLIKIFSRYGPLNESMTEVVSKSKRAKVVFKRRSDAETASSNAEKSTMFGSSLVCYNLKPLPIKALTVRTRSKKAAKSA